MRIGHNGSWLSLCPLLLFLLFVWMQQMVLPACIGLFLLVAASVFASILRFCSSEDPLAHDNRSKILAASPSLTITEAKYRRRAPRSR
ncbi:hypothetical protein, partial [Prevotella sp. HJM029]|uniref:hypothetical protein n=1 Tax=Prevotella sp. HJM029 TaxID=1433844 RepID=UPI0005689808